jgi:lipoyl(octanoyl) transferase
MSDRANPDRRCTRAGFLGRLPYARTTALQHELRSKLMAGDGEEALLLLEHPPVYTLGRNADRADLLADSSELARRGVEVHESNRGGKVTYHGPGQLVGYPIIDLKPDRRDVRRYIGDLQRVLIGTLARYDVAAEARHQPETGVWVGSRKIASFGVHLSRWVTMHGFALNVTTELEYFGGIVACGLVGVEMCSIESLTGARPPLEEVAAACSEEFASVFDRRLEPFPADLVEQTLGAHV